MKYPKKIGKYAPQNNRGILRFNKCLMAILVIIQWAWGTICKKLIFVIVQVPELLARRGEENVVWILASIAYVMLALPAMIALAVWLIAWVINLF